MIESTICKNLDKNLKTKNKKARKVAYSSRKQSAGQIPNCVLTDNKMTLVFIRILESKLSIDINLPCTCQYLMEASFFLK